MNKSKAQITDKLMERRREDVRDQMIELSSKPPGLGGPGGLGGVGADAGVAEAARQRRSAEREGRRRRRQQARATGHKQTAKVVGIMSVLVVPLRTSSPPSPLAQRRHVV